MCLIDFTSKNIHLSSPSHPTSHLLFLLFNFDQVSSTTIDFRSGRASALGLRWDREDAKNRAKYGQHGGGCDEGAGEWGEESEDDDYE